MSSPQQTHARVLKRFRALMDQIAEEEGGWDNYGVKRAVARRMGISETVVAKLLKNPTREIDLASFTATLGTLNLDPTYFVAQRLPRGEDWRAYVAGSEGPNPPFWTEFLERYAVTRRLSQSEIDRVRTLAHAEAEYLSSYEDLVGLADSVRLRSE